MVDAASSVVATPPVRLEPLALCATERPCFFKIWAIILAVEVFPFDPVTARIFPSNRKLPIICRADLQRQLAGQVGGFSKGLAQQIQKLPQQKGQFHFHKSTSIEIKLATEQAARQSKCIQIPLYSIINQK